MKKFNKMIIVVIISILVIVPTFSQSYNFNVGDMFNYELISAKMDLVLETTVANFTGINIAGTNVPEGNLFSFNISSMFENYYSIELISGTLVEKIFFYDRSFIGMISGITEIPMYAAIELIQGGQALIDYCTVRGQNLVCHPFIKVDTETWASAKEMFSTFDTDFTSYNGENASIENFNVLITERRKSNQIETFFKGSFNDSAENIFNFAQSYKFAYSPQTGAILGSRFKGYFQGKMFNTSINIALEQYFEMLGFELKLFEIGEFATVNVSGHSIIQVVGVFLVFTIPVIFEKKTKKGIKSMNL